LALEDLRAQARCSAFRRRDSPDGLAPNPSS
jgi:hypothetical protein